MAEINMEAIRAALARRQGGGGTPALAQQTSPLGVTPLGGPNTPTVPPAPPPPMEGSPGVPSGSPPTGGQTEARPETGTGIDPDTKRVMKALMSRLVQLL